jgi:hypothetical protein
LREAGPEVTHEDERSGTEVRDRMVSIAGSAEKKFIALSGAAGSKRTKERKRRSTTSFTKRKEEFLRDLAPALSTTLGDAAALSKKGSMLVVLDDFYMIEQRNQPLVLDHLHGITKRTPVWLKIGTVRSRTQTFINGDPPVGMQSPGDFHPLSLDVGLEKFPTAKAFLEEVAVGVLKPAGFELLPALMERTASTLQGPPTTTATANARSRC